MLAQVQTDAPLHFTKPFILVTRVGDNVTNNPYHNPYQKYYACDTMKQLFESCNYLGRDETPVSALRITRFSGEFVYSDVDNTPYHERSRADYFHNFTAALDEYKRGIRVDM